MPSQYCTQNPGSFICATNPNYNPNGGIFNPFPTSPEYPPISLPTSLPPTVKINTNTGGAGGITAGNTTLDKILNTFLSTFALHKGAGYVPTSAQPIIQNPPFFPPNGYPVGGGIIDNTGTNNALGGVEEWIKNNTGVVLIGSAIFAAYLMKSPRGR